MKLEEGVYYSVYEVSNFIGVTPVSIRNWIHAGKLKGRKFYGRWIISADEVCRLLEDVNTY